MRNLLSLIGNLAQAAPGRQERSIEEHQAILDAIRAGDADAARRATFAHLGSIEADSLGALEQFTAESASAG
jgi:DNA-binding GntR family transcriptional regulator